MKRIAWLITGLVILLSGGALVATAQPPRAGLCDGLTGDALTTCLYSELDDRLRANGMPPTTPTPTPTPTATPSPVFAITASDITADSVKVNWPAWTGATGYNVGRDGRDTGCSTPCPWSTDDPATARSRVFDHLLPDTEYTFTVKVLPDGPTATVKATTAAAGATTSPSPSPTATPTPTPTTPSTGLWLSGSAGGQTSVDNFGTWRGADVEIVGTWLNDPAIYPFAPGGEYAGWTGAADVGITPGNWGGWANEANGGNDAFWRATAKKLKEYRAGKGITYVRPWYEYNGNWMTYKATAADVPNFKTAFARVEAIFATEFPEAKMMLGSAASASGGYSVESSWPAGVDVLSIDFYNEWPWCNTQACFDDKIENSGGVNSLADLQRLAKAKGVPIIISEWANANKSRAASSGGGGDAPQFFASMHAWMKANAGTGPGNLIGEVYFNIPSGYAAEFWLRNGATTNPAAPLGAARYKELWVTT